MYPSKRRSVHRASGSCSSIEFSSDGLVLFSCKFKAPVGGVAETEHFLTFSDQHVSWIFRISALGNPCAWRSPASWMVWPTLLVLTTPKPFSLLGRIASELAESWTGRMIRICSRDFKLNSPKYKGIQQPEPISNFVLGYFLFNDSWFVMHLLSSSSRAV